MSDFKILVLNGPNLDMLGTREPEIYGLETLADLEEKVRAHALSSNASAICRQSNSEGVLIDEIHAAQGVFDGIVYNPGAHTHYSYALRDAIASIDVPVVEVHLSDIDAREEFRRVSVIAPACIAQVKGKGVEGYCEAIDLLLLCAKEIAEAPDEQLDNSQPHSVGQSVDLGTLSYERRQAARDAYRAVGATSLLVRDTSNIRWLTAFDGVFDEERAHALLIADDGAYLHSDSRYSNALRAAAARIGSDVIVSDERLAHAQFAFNALSGNGSMPAEGKLAIENSITYAEYLRMEERFTAERLLPTSDLILGLRAVKDASEIARLKAAQAVTDAAFAHIVKFMRPGMTEREVQLELEDYLLRHGGEGLAFSSIVATGVNGADPHAIPGNTRLEAGQCVVLDFGAKALGYCADMTRTVFLGAPEGTMAEAWSVLRQANEEVEAMLKPGVTGAEAHQLAEDVLAAGGFGGKMGHGLGHGVGIDVHELPVLNLRNTKPLVSGNVVTVEPGIYLPGQFGMRLEDCGLVTDTGYEPFAQSTHEMVII